MHEVPEDVTCGICGFQGHWNDQCLMFIEVNSMRGYNAYNFEYTSSPSSSSLAMYIEELIWGLTYGSNSF